MRSRDVLIGVLAIALLLCITTGGMIVAGYEDVTIPCEGCHDVTDVLTLTSNATGTVDVVLGKEFILIVDAAGYTRGDRGFTVAIYKSWADNDEFDFIEGFVSDGSTEDLNQQMRAIRASFAFTALSVGDYTIRIWAAGKPDLSTSLDVYVSVTVDDMSPPTIDNPSDVTIEDGESASIVWTPIDTYPATFEILINGSLVDGGEWNGSQIEFFLNTLSPGTHILVVTVLDLGGNSASDEVIVIVTDSDYSPTTPTDISSIPIIREDAAFQWSMVAVGWVVGFIAFFILYEYIRKR